MHNRQSVRIAALLLLLVAVTATVGGSRPAHAATTRVWTGAVNLNWSVPGNWNPAGVPVDGDSLVFGAAASGKTLNNDTGYFDLGSGQFVPVTLWSLAISSPVIIVGYPIALSSFLTATADSTLYVPVRLKGDIQLLGPEVGLLFLRPPSASPATAVLEMAGHSLTHTRGAVIVTGGANGTGTLTTTAGTLDLRYPAAFSGTIVATGAARPSFTSSFPIATTCGSAPNAAVVLGGTTLFVTCPASIRSVAGSGQIQLSGPASGLAIAGTGGGAVFDGKITGTAPAGISCCPGGGQTFRGASTFTGGVFITAGALTLDGATFPAASQFTVQGSGANRPTLGGFGSFGEAILTHGNLSLTSVAGVFGLARFPTLQFAPDVTVRYEIKGAAPGTGFTQIVMTGEVFLDNALLDLDFNGYQPQGSQSLTLIKGATALFDTFKNAANNQGLTEGAVFTADGMQFKITYVGGAGHDVIITRQGGASTPTPAPTATPTATPSTQPKNKRFLPALARDN